MPQLNFDANDVEPDDFTPIPAGDYVAVITESQLKPTKNGDGKYLQLNLQITEGEYQNRVLFDRLNIDNPNETARQIAYRTLSAICRAVGVMTPKDSEELHDIPMIIKVVKRPATELYGESNDIKGYKPYNAIHPGRVPKKATEERIVDEPIEAPASAKKHKKPWEQ